MVKIVLKYSFIALVALGLIIYLLDGAFWGRYLGQVKSILTQSPRGLWYSPLEAVEGGEQPLAVASVDALSISRQTLDELDVYLQNRNTYSFIVWHQGAIVHERYFGDIDKDTPIVSKSMAKPLASILIARAIEQGFIQSLDQKAADFITEWQGTEKEAISIRNVLDMSTGLWRYYQATLNPFSYFHQAYLSSRHEEVMINKLPLVDEPGTYYDYSQPVSDLVAVLVERATEQRYSEYLSDSLLKPIGAAGGEVWVNREGGVAHSGCCVMLPSQTWLRLGILLAQNGVWEEQRLLPEYLNTEVLKGSATNPNYSLNFWLGAPYQPRRYFISTEQIKSPGVLQSEPYLADDLFMFDGNGNQVVYIVPSRDLVIVRTGTWARDKAGGNEWDNTFLPNKIIRDLDARMEMSEGQEKASGAVGPPPNSLAMQTYAGSLGKVEGQYTPLPVEYADESLFQEAIDYAEQGTGYALLVWHRGALRLEKYFGENDEQLRPETASMHKSVFALLILAAIEDGYIESLDSPIGGYISEWAELPEGEISIRQMLNMAAGLAPLDGEGGMSSPRMRFFQGLANAKELLLGMRLVTGPGQHFSYANTNTQVLAMVLESATGKPYAEYLSSRLWKPLSADDAYVWNFEEDGFPRAYASLLATAKDWLRVGLLIQQRGQFEGKQLLSERSIDALIEPSSSNVNYGLHTWLGNEYMEKRYYNDQQQGFAVHSSEPFAVKDMLYFDGFGGQRVYISPSEELVVVRTGDTNMSWDDSALPNAVIKALLIDRQ